jgi:hypothetical protein
VASLTHPIDYRAAAWVSKTDYSISNSRRHDFALQIAAHLLVYMVRLLG